MDSIPDDKICITNTFNMTIKINKRDAVSVSWCESDFPCCLLFACYAICFSCVPFDRKLWWVFFFGKKFLTLFMVDSTGPSLRSDGVDY